MEKLNAPKGFPSILTYQCTVLRPGVLNGLMPRRAFLRF